MEIGDCILLFGLQWHQASHLQQNTWITRMESFLSLVLKKLQTSWNLCWYRQYLFFSPAPVVNIFQSCRWNVIFCNLPSQGFIITWLSIIFEINFILTSSISWRFILITWLYDAFPVIRVYMVLRFNL